MTVEQWADKQIERGIDPSPVLFIFKSQKKAQEFVMDRVLRQHTPHNEGGVVQHVNKNAGPS